MNVQHVFTVDAFPCVFHRWSSIIVVSGFKGTETAKLENKLNQFNQVQEEYHETNKINEIKMAAEARPLTTSENCIAGNKYLAMNG